MAEDYIEMETSSRIPVLHRGKEVAVGFNDLGSIQPLDELLSRYFPKKYGKDLQKNVQELTVNLNKYIKLSDIEKNERKTSFEKIVSAVNNINNAIKEDKDNKKKDKTKEDAGNKAIGAKIVQGIVESFATSFQKNMERMGFLRDLESAGVSVTQGFDSLRKASEELARPQEQLVKLYTKNSQTIQRLNASFGDGVNFFNQTLGDISGKFNTTRQEEEAILSEYIETRTKYANLEQLDRDRLRKETELYTKNLKQLSMATGKSIELILQENKLKEDEFAVQALRNANPAMEMLEKLLIQQVGPEMARALILNDVTSEKYLGAMATQQGRDYAQLRNMVARNPNMQMNDMIAFINASIERNQSERNRMNQALVNDALNSNLVYRPENSALFGQITVGTRGQKLSTYNENSTDSQILSSVRHFSDELDRATLAIENIKTQSLQNFGKELDVLANGLDKVNDVLLSISRMKDDFSRNYWVDLFLTIGATLGGSLLTSLFKSVGSMIVNAGTVTVNSALDGIGDLFGNSKKRGKKGGRGKIGKIGKMGRLAGIGKMVGGAATVAGVGLEGYSAYQNIRQGNYLDATSDALKAYLWANGPLLGMAGEGADIAGNWIGESIAKIQLALTGQKTMSAEERAALMRKNEELFKQRQQFLQSQNVVPPSQPSFNSNNSSTSNQTNQNVEAQRFNNSNNIQKDIKELNSLMLDALERIERGQQRQTQQLENLGFVAREKNTGVI